MDEYNYIQGFFDFHRLFTDIRKNTLKFSKTAEEYIDDYSVDDKKEQEELIILYRFIKDDKAVDLLLTEYEVGEDQDFNLQDKTIQISFIEDTSVHNEGGSHYGWYEYLFTIDTDIKIFTGLDVINHN